MTAGGVLPPVIAVLDANITQFQRKMGIAAGEMGPGGKLHSAMRGLATIGIVAGVAVAAIGTAAVRAASEFDASMERVHTQAGASQAEVEKLKTSVLELAGPVAQSPNELALGLYHIESAGFRGAQALDMLKAAAQGATIGNANLEDVSQAMIATMASGIKGVGSAADAMALLNTTVGIGDMKMEQLAKAMATGVLPAARVAGIGFNDVAAALATVTDNATPADETATRLRMTFAMLGAPTKQAANHLAAMGLSTIQLATDMRQPNGLLVALEDLRAHMDKMSGGFTGIPAQQALVRAFGGGRSSGTIMTLLTQMDRLKTKYAELGTASDRAGQYQEAWAKTQETFTYKVNALKATLEQLAVRLGNLLIPMIEKMVGWLLIGVRWLEQHKTAAEALGGAVAGVLVVAVAAAVVAFAEFVGITGLVVAGIGLLAAALVSVWTHSKTLRDLWKNDVLPVLIAVGTWVRDRLVAAWNSLWGVMEKRIIPAFIHAWTTIKNDVTPMLAKLREELQKHGPELKKLGGWIDALLHAWMQVWSWIDSKIIPILGWFAGGIFKVILGNIIGFVDIISSLVDFFSQLPGRIRETTAAVEQFVKKLPGASVLSHLPSGSLLGSMFGSSAGGGDQSAGQPKWVGEHGRELWIPRAAGTVLPAWQSRGMAASGGGGGGGVVELHTHLYLDSAPLRTTVQRYKLRNADTGMT